MSDSQLYEFLLVLIALLAGALLLAAVVRALARSQPGLAIGGAIATAFSVRVLASLAVDQTSSASQLRGGDELLFLGEAQQLTASPLASQPGLTALTEQLHVFFFSLNVRAFDAVPQTMLRIEVLAFAVIGLALLAAAVYELAGPRAAVIAAWLLALEPANVFFSGLLHKEPFMMLAEGLVAYGGARLWKRGDYRALAPMVFGCLIATAARPYVGWFLAAASAAIALHAGLRRNSASHSLALTVVVVALVVAFFPTVWNASSTENLRSLQQSQDANAADTDANLSLERVDYSTREKIIVNLPKRVADVTTRPYPWQLANPSQQLGAMGTVLFWCALALFVRELWRNGRSLMRRAGPLMYPAIFLLVAFSISAGNAGTAFRYRTHVVAFVLVLIVVLYSHRRTAETAREGLETEPSEPIRRRVSAPTLAR